MPQRRQRILLLHVAPATFVDSDESILAEAYEVVKLQFRGRKDAAKLTRLVKWSDAVVVWFAGDHAGAATVLAKLLGKPIYVFIGGYDVANVPELKYGVWATHDPRYKFLARLSLRHATALLPVDAGLVRDIKAVVQKHAPCIVVPTGTADPMAPRQEPRMPEVCTVAGVSTISRMKVKGVDRFLEAAKLMPDSIFRAIGLSGEALDWARERAPPNVRFDGPWPAAEVRAHLGAVAAYCQFSRREGLPTAAIEAAMEGAIVVGTEVPGVKTVVEATGGFLVPEWDPVAACEAIGAALSAGPEARDHAQAMAKAHFGREQRRQRLSEILASL